MNRGLLHKAFREVWASTLAFALGLFAFQLLLGLILPVFQKEFSDQLLRVEFLQRIIAALLGTEVGVVPATTALAMLGWVHPFVLAIVWAQAIVICTRFPAGEVDRGTIDVVLALPVRRTTVYLAESAMFLASAFFVVAVGWIGNMLGGRISNLERPGTTIQMLLVAVNLYGLAVAVGGVSFLFSSICDRRGRAVGLAFGVLLTCLFLTSMSAFNPVVKRFATMSLLTYYRPYRVLQSQGFPFADAAVLASVAVGCWALGWLRVRRRDFRIV